MQLGDPAVEAAGDVANALQGSAVFRRWARTHLCFGRSEETSRFALESQEVAVVARLERGIRSIHGA